MGRLPRSIKTFLIPSAILAALAAGCADSASRRISTGNDLYVQGALAYHEGDQDRALAALQTSLQQNPDLIMARFLLGTIHRDRGEYAAALNQYKRVVELDPYVYSNHYQVGLMHHLLNQLQEAAAAYREALRLNTEDAKSNMNLGLVYTALGRPEDGLYHAQKAVDLAPRSAEASANLGVVLDSMGDNAGAETAYRRAIELEPDRIEPYVNLAGCLYTQRRYKESAAVYEHVTKSAESTLIRQRYGYALLLSGRTDDALKQFDHALRLNPRNYQAINGMGDSRLAEYRASSLLNESKRLEALEFWKRSLAINPDQPRVQSLLKEHAGEGLTGTRAQ